MMSRAFTVNVSFDPAHIHNSVNVSNLQTTNTYKQDDM